MPYSKKKIKKLVDKKCFFCDLDLYETLDVHRIVAGCNGGNYNNYNSITVCANCHRLIHAGEILVDKKYMSTKGLVLHYYRNGEEMWKETNEFPVIH